MSYKITKADLIGKIANFPIEVVEKMIVRQVQQGNKANVSLFQRILDPSKAEGGFYWDMTVEGFEFWRDVIMDKNFKMFFTKYPKSHYVYIVQDGTKEGSDIIATLEAHGGVNNFALKAHWDDCIYYIDPIDKNIMALDIDDECKSFLKEFYTEIDVKPSVKEYTMQEIADKLGIDVANLRIKK